MKALKRISENETMSTRLNKKEGTRLLIFRVLINRGCKLKRICEACGGFPSSDLLSIYQCIHYIAPLGRTQDWALQAFGGIWAPGTGGGGVYQSTSSIKRLFFSIRALELQDLYPTPCLDLCYAYTFARFRQCE